MSVFRLMSSRAGSRAWGALLALALSVGVADAKSHPRGAAAHKRSHAPAKRHRHVRERPVATFTRSGLPNIQAKAALVVEVTDAGNVPLYQKNPDELRPIASVSKLLAMLVVVEHKLALDAESTITEADAKATTRGAKSRLLTGMTLSNRDLLHAALMASDNRAVLALGRAVGLSPTQHAALMTAKARALGLTKTTFAEPTGLNYGNVSTPKEVVVMLQAALKQPLLAQVSRTAHYVAHARRKNRRDTIEYGSTDVLLTSSRHVIHGGKTGYNDRAGYCLAVAAKIAPASGKPREVVMAFLGAEGKQTRFADFGRAAQWLVERAPAAPHSPATPPGAEVPPELKADKKTASTRKPGSPGQPQSL